MTTVTGQNAFSNSNLKKLFESFGATPDGTGFETLTSYLCPVRYQNLPAILKVVIHPDEKNSAALLEYYGGDGAVKLLARKENAFIMERAEGDRDLVSLVQSGHDDEATGILCGVIARLHEPKPHPPAAKLPSLRERFNSLFRTNGVTGLFQQARHHADRLLKDESDITVLHGDIHHENILFDRHRGWLAVDPKGILGERTYEYANTLCNPEKLPHIVEQSSRFAAQAKTIAKRAGLPLNRLIGYAFCHAALMAAWSFEDTQSEDTVWYKHGMRMAEIIKPFLNTEIPS